MSKVDPEPYREQLAHLCRRKHCRSYGWPHHWQPRSVINPVSELPFTDITAWELIADRLESGHPIETITLKNPPGKTAFVMKIELAPNTVPVYVKIQFGAGKVVGRSFHLSVVKKLFD